MGHLTHSCVISITNQCESFSRARYHPRGRLARTATPSNVRDQPCAQPDRGGIVSQQRPALRALKPYKLMSQTVEWMFAGQYHAGLALRNHHLRIRAAFCGCRLCSFSGVLLLRSSFGHQQGRQPIRIFLNLRGPRSDSLGRDLSLDFALILTMALL